MQRAVVVSMLAGWSLMSCNADAPPDAASASDAVAAVDLLATNDAGGIDAAVADLAPPADAAPTDGAAAGRPGDPCARPSDCQSAGSPSAGLYPTACAQQSGADWPGGYCIDFCTLPANQADAILIRRFN